MATRRSDRNPSRASRATALPALRPIAYCVMLACCDTVLANPTAPQVVNGAASFARPDARTLNVTNSPGAIIHWQGFSIGANEVTRFVQQSGSSAVLNRVVGADISRIQGQLLSNGRVFLINPAGIVVSGSATIDTAGFVGSTLNMLNADFLAGKLRFEGGSGAGSIVNQGWIKAGAGGNVVLVAPNVENSGVIEAPNGQIVLAAGRKLTIGSLDLEGVQFEIQAPADSALNVGKLLADGGAVGVFAGTLRHSGDIRANALTRDEAGRVVLKAAGDAVLGPGSTISATGKTGGDIRVLGNRVALLGDAGIDASGTSGGGQILVGGDFQGRNPDVPNSRHTIVDRRATLRADAVDAGDGGKIIVWSDDVTQYYGKASVRGGPQGGNGGFVEVSGKRYLDFRGTADRRAPRGNAGTLLLDPTTINIVAADDPGTPNTESEPIGVAPGTIFREIEGPPAATTSEITVATLLDELDGGNVIINTNSGASGDGDINLNAQMNFAPLGGTRTLTLAADRNINISNPIFRSTGSAALNINLISTGVTNISAGVDLSGGVLNATTGGSGIVNFTANTFSVPSQLTATTANFTGAAVTFGSATITNMSVTAGSATFNGGATITTLAQNAGTVSFNDTDTTHIGTVNLAGGTLGGSGSVQINTALDWSGGTMAGTGTTNVAAGAGFSLSGGPTLQRGLTTASTSGVWSGNGTFTLDGATFTNSGTLTATGDGAVGRNNPGTFANSGTFDKNGGAGTTTFSDSTLTLTNTGTMRVSTGTIAVNSTFNNRGIVDLLAGRAFNINGNGSGWGVYTIGAGGQVNLNGGTQTFIQAPGGALPGISGDGVFRVAGGTMTVDAPMSADRLTLDSGIVNGAAALTIDNALVWSGGTMSGAGSTSVAAAASFALSGNTTLTTRGFTTASTTGVWSGDGTFTIDGATFTNNGTLTATGNGSIGRNNPGVFLNAGTFEKNGAAGTTTFSDSSLTLTNTGTLRVTTGTLQVSSEFNNRGLVEIAANRAMNINGTGSGGGDYTIAAGGQVSLNGGTQTFDTTGGAPDISGDGVFRVAGGTMTVNTAMNADRLTLDSGIVNGAAALTIDNALVWSGGTMSGAGSTLVDAAASFALSGNTTLTTRSLTTNSTSGVWSGNGTFTIDGATFTNNGTLTATGNGLIARNNPGVFVNAGTFDKNGPGTGTGTTFFGDNILTVTNTGTLRVSTGALQVNSTFNNEGAVEVLASRTMNITQSGSGGGTYDIGNEGSVNVTGGTQIFNTTGGTPAITGGGLFRVSGGTMTVNTDLSADNLALVSGTINGNASVLTVNNSLVWSGGTMAGSGTTNVLDTASFDLSGSPTLTTRAFNTDSDFGVWSGNGTFTIDGATFTNTGVLTATGDGALARNNPGVFVNAGTFEKNGGSGTTTFGDSTLTFTNTGTLKVSTGTLTANSAFNNRGLVDVQGTLNIGGSGSGGGQYTIASESQVNLTGGTQVFDLTGGAPDISGNGVFRIDGGIMTVSADMHADRLTLASGTLNGANALTVDGRLTWSGGTMSGAGSTVVDAAATFALSGNTALTTRSLTSNSTNGVWSGDGTFTIDGATFTNNGTLVATGNGSIGRNNPGVFVNAGTFRKNGGTGTTTFGDAALTVTNTGTLRVSTGTLQVNSVFHNRGLVELDDNRVMNISGDGNGGGQYELSSGSLVNLTGGTQTFDTTGGAPDVDGQGTFRIAGGTLAPNTAMNIDRLELASGTLTGTGAVTIQDSFVWSGGTITQTATTASLSVDAEAALNLSGNITLTNRPFTTASTAGVWSGNSTFTIDGATFTNNGTLTATGNGAIGRNNPGTFLNAGTFDKNGGAGTTTFGDSLLTFTNTGTLRVSTGTLQVNSAFNNRGLVEIAANRVMNISGSGSGGGVYDIEPDGQVNLTGGTQTIDNVGGPPQIKGAGLFTVNGGTLTVNEDLTAFNFALASGAVNGNADLLLVRFDWSGGTMAGAGTTLVPGEGGGMTLSGSPTLIGRSLVNDGGSTWSGNGTFTLDNATFTNNASFQMTGDGVMAAVSLSSFVNNGELSKNGGTATTSFQVPLNNTTFGTVRAETGTLQVTGGFTQNGTVATAAGATFSRPGGFVNNGVIAGNGTIDVGAGNAVTNAGTLKPGDSPGTLNITGDLELAATGTTEIEIQDPGATAGADYDRINVTGQVRGAAASPNNWGTLEVTHLGGFVPNTGSVFTIMTYASRQGDFTTTNFPGGFGYAPSPGGNDYVLLLNTVTNSWMVDGNGDWSAPSNWSLGVAPRGDHRIVIDRPAGDFTITLPTGAFVADRIDSAEKLVLDGGTLTLANASTIGNAFTINNGAVQGAASVTVNGPFVLNGGILANTGGFTVNGTSAVSGISALNTTLTTDVLNLTGGALSVAPAGGLRIVDNVTSTIAPGATLIAQGPFELIGATLDNQGAVQLLGPSNMRLNDGAVVNNAGTFGFLGDAGIEHTFGAAPAFNNTGTVAKVVGTGVSHIGAGNAFPVTNAPSGTIHVQTGTLHIDGFPVNDGTISTITGATFTTNGADLTNNGTVQGTGTVAVGTLFNNGTVSPGLSPGRMLIDGNYTQGPGGRLLIELAGHDPGVTFDRLDITGAALLDGTLDVVTLNGFNPEPGDRFAFMTYASRNGDFTTMNVPPGDLFQSTPGSNAYGVDTLAPPVAPQPPTPPAQDPQGGAPEVVVARSNQETTRLSDDFIGFIDTSHLSQDDRERQGRQTCQ